MTTHEDTELSKTEGQAAPGTAASLADAPIDEQRARDLDALADIILSRRTPPPKTLLGLGVPQPTNGDPTNGDASAEAQPISDPEPTRVKAAAFAVTASHPPPTPRERVTPVNVEATTITPPPNDEPPLQLGELLSTKRYDVFGPKPRSTPLPEESLVEYPTQPRAASTPPRSPSTPPSTPPRSPSTPPGEAFEPRVSAVRSEAPWAMGGERRPDTALGSRLLLIALAFAASLAATIALVNWLVPSRKGSLLVTAAGPNQLRIERAEVVLDGKPVCVEVPCRLEGLTTGTHAVSVYAKGYDRMAAQAIAIRPGVESALQLTLNRRDTAALRINVNVPGLSVRLDGEDRGAVPTTIHQLSPTEHSVRLSGNAAYAPFEQRVTLEADTVVTLEPKLLALHGVLHLTAGSGADNAKIELIRGGERSELAKLPVDVELLPGQSLRVHASRKSFEDYDAEIAFSDSQPEQSLSIALRPRDGADSAEHRGTAPLIPPIKLEESLPSGAAPPPANGAGTVSINSIPISRILVDGKPMGSTPQKLTLSPGSHSLVFVHPTLGRQERSVNVVAGQAAVAAVRF